MYKTYRGRKQVQVRVRTRTVTVRYDTGIGEVIATGTRESENYRYAGEACEVTTVLISIKERGTGTEAQILPGTGKDLRDYRDICTVKWL